MARRIIRTTSYNAPSKRTVVRRKDGKLTARQKWLNGLGKRGMFDWEVLSKRTVSSEPKLCASIISMKLVNGLTTDASRDRHTLSMAWR